jgi:hypothetical protein
MQPFPTHPKPQKTMENTDENRTPCLYEIEATKRHEKCIAEAHALREDAQMRVVNLRLAVGMLTRMLEQAETMEGFASVGLQYARDLQYEVADNNTLIIRTQMQAHRSAVRQVGLGLSEIG